MGREHYEYFNRNEREDSFWLGIMPGFSHGKFIKLFNLKISVKNLFFFDYSHVISSLVNEH